MDGQRKPQGRRRSALLAMGAVVWLVIAQDVALRAATGLGSQWFGGLLVPTLRGIFVLFLVALGLSLLQWRHDGEDLVRRTGLIQRRTASRELAVGAMVAWGVVVACMVPLLLSRALEVTFWTTPRGWLAAVCSLAGLACWTLATEVVFRSYALERLSEAVGRSWAVAVLVLLYGLLWGVGGPRSFLVACGLGLLFSVGWLRTHATWMPWGLHLGWSVGLGVLFGLPILDGGDVSSIVLGQVVPGTWLSIPQAGPSGMLWSLFMLLGGVAVLVAVTRNYAWSYTHPVIVPGGYPMEATPPPAHVAMQAGAAAAPTPLVQILPTSGALASQAGKQGNDAS